MTKSNSIQCEINPSAIQCNGDEYILYRQADYPQNTPAYYVSSHGIRIDFYRGAASYILVKNSGQKKECKFNFKNYSYFTSRMVDLYRTNKHKIEDLRFVENSIEERNGSIFCLACCSVFSEILILSGEKKEDGSWNEKKPLGFSWRSEPGICWVNLNSGEIDFVKTLNQEKLNVPQKNWMIFKDKDDFYCIYSIDPLVYTSSKSLESLSFNSIQLNKKPLMHNSTCPIKIGENRYCMLCQEKLNDFKSDKKIAWAYNKYFVSFDLIDGEITNITKTLLKDIPLEYYCSSIIKENNKIKVFAGVEDVDNTFFYIDNPDLLDIKMNSLDKKYTWCFAGQIHVQGDRAKMIESLKKCNGKYHLHVADGWRSENSLSTEQYKNVLSESIFVPCPRGNTSVDTFRLYEALEVGAIPIVEKSDYWRNLLGEHPLIETASWENISNDINLLLQNSQWIIEHSKKVESWWVEYKKQLKQNIAKIVAAKGELGLHKQKQNNTLIDPLLKTKQKEFISLKNQWLNFFDNDRFGKHRKLFDWVEYISSQIPAIEEPEDRFNCFNPFKKIAIVSLYTKEISEFAVHSEKSIKDYCEKQGYSFYVYRESLDKNGSPNWSKSQALLNHINDHEYIVWMDSDTIIFNPEKRFENIIEKAPKKFVLATKDIGNNSMLNSGVLIFKSHEYNKNLIKKWRDFNGDKSSLYASGGDQEILCEILRKSDGFGFNRKIFPMNEFNTDPRLVNEDTFILHFMAYPYELKKIFMSYFSS